MLGVETGIPEAVQEAFKDTGTSHIIAISGFNITILAALFAMIFGRLLGRWRGALVALVAITIYTLLVGADAAVFWTAIMGGLTLGEVALLSSVTKPKVVFFAKIVYMLKYDIINKPNQWQSVTSVSRIRFQGETHE